MWTVSIQTSNSQQKTKGFFNKIFNLIHNEKPPSDTPGAQARVSRIYCRLAPLLYADFSQYTHPMSHCFPCEVDAIHDSQSFMQIFGCFYLFCFWSIRHEFINELSYFGISWYMFPRKAWMRKEWKFARVKIRIIKIWCYSYNQS